MRQCDNLTSITVVFPVESDTSGDSSTIRIYRIVWEFTNCEKITQKNGNFTEKLIKFTYFEVIESQFSFICLTIQRCEIQIHLNLWNMITRHNKFFRFDNTKSHNHLQ